MQWRLAELTPPAAPFDLRTPRKYEVEADWVSAVIAPYAATVTVPAEVLRVGALHRARVRMLDNTGRFGRWSAPLEFTPTAPASPLAPQSALRVTELHYHPPGGAPEEFIELANIGAVPLDLTHVTLGGAVRFAFAGSQVTRLQAGERVVVVESREDLRARYGGKGLLVAGEYAGRLSDSHEELSVTVGRNLLVQRFTYSHLWQPASDGQGKSLEIIDPRGALPSWDQAAAWRASAAYGGTPGR